jgi:hypothetical protein
MFSCLTCFTGILGGSSAAGQFRLNGFFSFSAWLAAIAEAAVLLLAFGSAPISAGCLPCRLVRQW